MGGFSPTPFGVTGGQVFAPTPQSLGMSPVQDPAGLSWAQGINSFIQNYRAARDIDKDRARKEVEQDIKNLSLGIPIDMKKTMKSMQKAGMNIDVEGPTQKEIQQAQASNMTAELLTGFGGATPRPASQTRGAMSRFTDALGFTAPPVSMESPGAQFLARLRQEGEAQRQLNSLQNKNQVSMAQILDKALQGDSEAVGMARNLGLFKDISDYERMAQMYGSKKTVDFIMNEKLAPWGAIMQKSEHDAAQLNWMKYKEMKEEFFKLTDMYPTAPVQLLQALTSAQATGNKEVTEAVWKELRNFPTKQRLEVDKSRRAEGREDQRLSNDRRRLGQEDLRIDLQSQKQNFDQMLETKKFAGDMFDRYFKIAKDEDATQEEKNAAKLQMVNSANEAAGRTVITVKKVDHWFSDDSYEFREPPGTNVELAKKEAGVMDQVPGIAGKYAKEFADFIALMPPEVKKTMMMQMPMGFDMNAVPYGIGDK